MVVARCCPGWVGGVFRGPQPWVVTDHPRGVATLVYWSLAFGASLSDLFGADYPGRPARTEVNWVYWVWRTGFKVYVKSFPPAGGVPTCSDLWSSADWFEREVWEMFGVPVRRHPDLRRLITDYGFVGHPLRKDFPVTGYLEVAYSEVHRRVVSKPVTLTQEFRLFDFGSPWLS